MTKYTNTLTIAAMFAVLAPSFVAADTLTDLDANEDTMVTIDEVTAVYPETTEDAFAAMDANADGSLDADEIEAAQNAGMLKMSE